MDEEKMQRQMEFILEQQAQVAVSHTKSAARIAQLEELLVQFARATRERFEGTDQRAQEESRKAAKRSEELDRKIAALVDAQIRAEDKAPDIERRVALLFESQRKTEEAVRNLAAVVERHIVEGHNGRARPGS